MLPLQQSMAWEAPTWVHLPPRPHLQLCPSPDANASFSFLGLKVLPTWALALTLVFTTLALLPALRFCGIHGYR